MVGIDIFGFNDLTSVNSRGRRSCTRCCWRSCLVENITNWTSPSKIKRKTLVIIENTHDNKNQTKKKKKKKKKAHQKSYVNLLGINKYSIPPWSPHDDLIFSRKFLDALGLLPQLIDKPRSLEIFVANF